MGLVSAYGGNFRQLKSSPCRLRWSFSVLSWNSWFNPELI